jgi:hypothetical protein
MTSEWPCSITWRQAPPTPAQRAAWDKLWTRLLGPPDPETPQPQEDPPGATQHDGSDGTDQAVGAASTPPRGECHGAL